MSNCDKNSNCGTCAKRSMCFFPVVYGIFAFSLLAYGYLLNDRLDEAMDNTLPIIDHPHAIADITAPKAGSVVKGVDLAAISQASDELLARGKAVYGSSCTACHGADGDGKGAAGGALTPPPRDFLSAEGWTNGTSFSALYKTLQEGVPDTGMGAYDTMPIMDRVAMIHYIRSLADHYPAIDDADIAKTDKTYALSEDKVSANRIPRSMATAVLVEEASDFNTRVLAAVSHIDAAHDAGANLLKANAANVQSALVSVKRSGLLSGSATSFAKTISRAPRLYGFKAQVSRLTKTQWQALFTCLSKQAI